MKYLFIVQGEGRGHLMQALTLREILVKNGHQVVEVLVGKSPHRQIPAFFSEKIQSPFQTFDSPNFLPAQKGHKVPIVKSVIYNTRRSPVFLKSVRFLESRIRETQPDVVVNFYDFLAGLLFELYKPDVKFVCIAHQYLFLHPGFSFSRMKLHPELPSLLLFTKLTCMRADKILALSFGTEPTNDDAGIYVVPPLLRKEIFEAEPSDGDFILGYMLNASFQEEVIHWHNAHKHQQLEFFWDKNGADETTVVDESLSLHKLNDIRFVDYMSRCKAYASTSGFESICEAMYLRKPIMMVPAHIEQICNAMDAERAGAGITSDNFHLDKLLNFIPEYKPFPGFRKWVRNAESYFIRHLTGFDQ